MNEGSEKNNRSENTQKTAWDTLSESGNAQSEMVKMMTDAINAEKEKTEPKKEIAITSDDFEVIKDGKPVKFNTELVVRRDDIVDEPVDESIGEIEARKVIEQSPDNDRIEQQDIKMIEQKDDSVKKAEIIPVIEDTPEIVREDFNSLNDQIKDIRKEIEDIENSLLADRKPLVAINANMSHDAKELASDLAEAELNKEVSEGGFVKKLWKGTLFKKYYQKQYEKNYLDKDKAGNVYEILESRKEGSFGRFVNSVIEKEDDYIHDKVGEKRQEADPETTAAVRKLIEKYASAPEDAKEEDLRRELENEAKRLQAEAHDNGRPGSNFEVNNYLDVAKQARQYALQHISMDKIMEGFKVYNAEVRDGIRTEAHREGIDKIINAIENNAVGQFIPPEIIAGAVSIAAALTQTGARAMAGAAGGLAASSIMAGLKERNRITEDRVRMLRDLANGMDYENDGKTGKYEAIIAGTIYDLRPASELTKNLEDAMSVEDDKGRRTAILSAIAEARVRIDFSDEKSKDLIAYSSADNRGKERLNLDIALIKAKKALPKEDLALLDEMNKSVFEEISKNVDEKDKDFNKKRAFAAITKAGKTFAIGATAFVATQEITALINPNKIGLFEKAGLIKTTNGEGARETLLAGTINNGPVYRTETVGEPIRLRSDQKVEIEQLEKTGKYTKVTVEDGWTENPSYANSVKEVKPETLSNRLRVKYDGWMNNGTKAVDGNELRAYLKDGQMISDMKGISTMGNQSFNYDELAAAGKIKGYLTIGNTKFEIASTVNEAGQLTWGENGVFTTTAGETIKAVGDNGEKLYKYFEIAMDNGTTEDGVQHIIPFATDIGKNTFSGTIQEVVSAPIEHPAVYEFVKTVTSEVPRAAADIDVISTAVGMGANILSSARTGLGGPRNAENIAPNTNTTEGTTSDNATSAAPNVTPETSNFKNEILDQAKDLGDFASFITESDHNVGFDIREQHMNYADWWDRQGDEAKARAGAILKKMLSSDEWHRHSNWGIKFMTWIQIYHPEVLA